MMKYSNDPEAVEYVRTPVDVLRDGKGDCDCAAGLVAAMLEAAGIPWRVWIPREVDPDHVAIQAQVAGRWIHLDPTDSPATLRS